MLMRLVEINLGHAASKPTSDPMTAFISSPSRSLFFRRPPLCERFNRAQMGQSVADLQWGMPPREPIMTSSFKPGVDALVDGVLAYLRLSTAMTAGTGFGL